MLVGPNSASEFHREISRVWGDRLDLVGKKKKGPRRPDGKSWQEKQEGLRKKGLRSPKGGRGECSRHDSKTPVLRKKRGKKK